MQYKILFKDSTYIFLLLSGAHIFGLMGALGATLVQQVVIWGFDEVRFVIIKGIGSLLAAGCVIIGLVSSIVYSILYLEKRGQLIIFSFMQFFCFVSMGGALAGMVIGSTALLVAGVILYAICAFPCFPLILELIGKRYGKDFELIATANVYILTPFITSILLFLDGLLLDSGTEAGSYSCFAISCGLLICNLFYGLIARSLMAKPFRPPKPINPKQPVNT